MNTFTPDNYRELIKADNKNLDVWLDAAMVDELKRSQPQESDSMSSNGERSAERLAEECSKLFPRNRVFCCKNQLVVLMKAF